VKRALSNLSETYRAVVVLRQYERLKYREIAEVLEIPEGTVKWRMAEALTQLGQELAPLASDAPVRRAAAGPPR
jgi:RNA polymerase sigma-70 factor (ECF subfamily)